MNRQNRDSMRTEEAYLGTLRTITTLKRQIAAQHRLIEELEKQLEPEVVNEIRNALSEEAQ